MANRKDDEIGTEDFSQNRLEDLRTAISRLEQHC